MPSLQNKLLANDMDFQTCGVIKVAAKYNAYAMSCNYCSQKFSQIQMFMKHLKLQHTEKVQFDETNKDVEVYSVDELMAVSKTNKQKDNESEEPGLTDEPDENWLTEEDRKWLDEDYSDTEKDNLKGKSLANKSVLKALQDFDVSFSFADNLDNTMCLENVDSDNEEVDSILNNTLLQEIQNDLNVSDEKKSKNEIKDSTKDVLEADVTMTEEKGHCNKSAALKGLLEGLEDLDDVDSLLDNLEDSVIENPPKNVKPIVINLQGISKSAIASDSSLETTTIEDLDFTLKVNDQIPKEENVINFKLSKKIKNGKNKLCHTSETNIKTQQKMILNIQSGEFEELQTDNQQSEEEENLIFNNFINKTKNGNLKTDDNQKFNLNPEDSIMDDLKLQLSEDELEENSKISQNSKVKENTELGEEENSKISQNSTVKENAELEDFDMQLKNLEESLQDNNSKGRELVKKCSKKSTDSTEYPKNLSENANSNNTEDFDLQLKNIEASLNEECSNTFNNSAYIVKDDTNCQFSKMKNLIKELDLEFSETEDDLLEEKSKEFSNNVERNSMHNYDQSKDKHFDKEFESLQSEEINSAENTKHSSSAPLNDKLTRALTEALEGDDLNLLNFGGEEEETDPPLNQHLQDLLTQELMEEETTDGIIKGNPTTPQKINIKKDERITKETKPLKYTDQSSNSHYAKTNINAKNKQSLNKRNIESKCIESKILTIQNAQITLKTNKLHQNSVKDNPEKHLQNKTSCQKTPKKYKENQENLNLNSRLRKTPYKENQENGNSNLRLHETPNKENSNLRLHKTPNKENQEHLTPDFIKKIKKEKFTPHQSFINTQRGDRTPLKRDEMFLKHSPKTQEKMENLMGNFTPTKGDETTPTTKEQIFLKHSPKTQEKYEEIKQIKTPKRNVKTANVTEQITLKQNPKTIEKNEHLANNRIQKTPGKYNLRLNKTEAKKPQQKQDIIRPIKATKKIFTSPIKSPKENGATPPLLTPQRTKNVAIKLPRLTPDKLKQIQKPPSANVNTKSLENKTYWNNFKLPSGITLSKVSSSNNNKTPQLQETSLNTENHKENGIESSQQNIDVINLIIKKDMPDPKISLIQPLKLQNSTSNIRQRKASIDIIPNQRPITQHQPKITPKHSNLDYKSYAINRSARKKEVLQRMSLIKKQIFKSIENSNDIKIERFEKSPKKKNIQIENIQILPKIQQQIMTPLINNLDNLNKPFAKNVDNTSTPSSSTSISPKNLNDDEKEAKKSLNVPNSNLPINDDEKLIKKSLKRPATSPLKGDDKQCKRHHKSPAVQTKNNDDLKSSVLESTQLGLSESVVDFLQRDLKANRLNMDSFLNEDLPIDDNAPNETSMESNGTDKNIKENEKDTITTDNNNILDDLLTQVDNEKKNQDEKPQHKKVEGKETTKEQHFVIDFDETRDINLLNKLGLKIIKCPDIEDVIPFEEVEEMHEKAKIFADIYKHYQRIWCSKNGENPNIRQELHISFSQFLTQTNQILNLQLNMTDIRRLVNIITFWYAQNFNSKLIEKKNISEATNRYLFMFYYIPKTSKRIYYCEFCDECFTTEHKYFTHRIVHTGAPFPYTCSKCSMGFRTLKTCKTHEQQCSTIQSENVSINPLTKNSANHIKCKVCSEIFETTKLLYDHSKTHLKTTYNCVKCQLVFASASEVQKHMSLCNRSVKRIPKQSTPRPTKPKVESHSKN